MNLLPRSFESITDHTSAFKYTKNHGREFEAPPAKLLSSSGQTFVEESLKQLEERKERIRKQELHNIENKRRILEAKSSTKSDWNSTLHRINEFQPMLFSKYNFTVKSTVS
jgi:hypothetical protein